MKLIICSSGCCGVLMGCNWVVLCWSLQHSVLSRTLQSTS